MKPTPEGLPRTFRLNDPSDFTRVLEQASFRRRHGALRIMATANTMQTARIGLIVGKRVLRRAVDRNRAKRTIRETFRLHRADLPNIDIVVQVIGPAPADGLREPLLALFGEIRNSCQ